MIEDIATLEDDFPVFNALARTIKPLAAVIVRDKGSKGDTQARKKSMAMKELAFVWFYTSILSSYRATIEDDDERASAIKRDMELGDNWKIDKVVQDAIDYYANYIKTPTSEILQTVRRTLNKSKKVFLILEGKLDGFLAQLETDTELSPEQVRVIEDNVVALISRIMEMSSKLTTQLELLDSLEDKYVKELEVKKGRNKTIVNQWEI